MRQAITPENLNWRPLHAVVFLLFFLAAARIPMLGCWPWQLLAPVIAYGFLCGLISPLRRTCVWMTFGRWDRLSLVATALIVAMSTIALVLYQWIATPDVGDLVARLPTSILGSAVLAGTLFAVVNASLEEIAFRGILYDGLESQWGWQAAVVITALFFGIVHVRGYPPGPWGAVLAGLYGMLLGWLRRRTRGLALPLVAHVCADAAVFGILVHGGDV